MLLGVALVLAGAAGASVNAASGRMVMGWFPRHERGLAMGTRQTAQPLGVALAALGLPPLARAHGVHLALLFPAALCAAAAVLVCLLVADPPRAGARPRTSAPAASPYRGSRSWPASTWPARCWSCRSSPSRRSPSSTWSGSGTGTPRWPAG